MIWTEGMLHSRFFWKLYAGYSALILFFAVIVGGLVTQQLEQDSRQEIERSLQARAVFLEDLARPYFDAPGSAFLGRVRALGEQIDTRLTVIRKDGVVIADSEEDPARMDNHRSRPEVLAARSYGQGLATRFSDTLGTKMMYLALPVEVEGHLVGYVRTSLPLSVIAERFNHLKAVVILGVGLASIVALVIGLVVARRFVTPLTDMTAVAESMADGDYSRRVPAEGTDEIGTLARALNRMAESCGHREQVINTDRGKLSAILAGMVEGVVAVNQDERVVHINEAAGRLLGASPQDSLDKPIWEVTRLREVREIIDTTLRDRSDTHGRLHMADKAANRAIDMHASPLHGSQGELAGAVLVLHDVSELHRLEMVRRDFVANASHELKTPITAIRGLIETLIDDVDMAAPQHDRFLRKIKDQSVRLSSIVTDLLAISRLESGSSGGDGALVDLRDPIRESAQALALVAEERQITLDAEMPGTPVQVVGDEEAVCHVLTNLLDNALKYTPKGGQVVVRLQRQADNAVIEVQDTGIGIEPGDCERIFERFYRVDKARSRELGGTGLGLSIVKHIVLAHRGQVSVTSVPGTGSTFRVAIPLAPAAS